MSHEAVVKLKNVRRISLEECLTSVTCNSILLRSPLESNVRSGGVPEGELIGCDGEVADINLWWTELQDGCCQQLWQL